MQDPAPDERTQDMSKAIVTMWLEIHYPEDAEGETRTPGDRRDAAVEALRIHAEVNGADLIVIRNSAFYQPAVPPPVPEPDPVPQPDPGPSVPSVPPWQQ